VDTEKVFMRRKPLVPIVLATTMVVLVAYLGAVAGPAAARAHRYRGAAPGAVTCQLSGTISFSPRMSATTGGQHARLKAKLFGCDTSNSAVTITSARVKETFTTSPLNCKTLASTGAAATLTVRWKGAVWGRGASFTPTSETNSRSQLVTNTSGQEGFAIPGGGGVSSASGSFAAASGSSANAYTTFTRTGLTSMCRTGVRSLVVSGTITLGSAANQGNLGGHGSQAGLSAIPLGDYAGSSDPSGLANFGFSTGTHPTYATEYLDKTDGWAAMDGAADVRPWKGSGYRLVLGVPILPGTGTLAAGATGSYDQYFTTLGKNLVSDGEANAILRLGWEFNGYWYPWYVQSSTDATNFDKFWQHIVTTMRAVAGEQFKFLWSTSANTSTSYSQDSAYPGDAYVDYVGTDNYDDFWGTPFTDAAAWSNQLTQQWGLNWLASFAAAHGKPIAIPEWSVEYRGDGHGMGDDPSFIANMAAWFVAHHVAFTDIFSFDSSDTYRNDILDGTFPKSLAEFKSVFG
jgi:hypothetical protein